MNLKPSALMAVGNGGFGGSIQGYGDMQMALRRGYATAGNDTRQGVMAAQRFPDDFDGIIAGALANRHIHQHTGGVARSIALARNPEGAIPATKAQMVSRQRQ